MLSKSKLIVFFATILVVTSCSDDQKLAKVGDKNITAAEFEAYLKFKRLPANDEKRRDSYLKQYLEREALAAAIEESSLLDQKQIEAELNEFRKEMLISRYFEKYLNDQVTDESVQNYYTGHAQEYEEKKVHVAHILIRTKPNMSEEERKAKHTTAQEAYSKIMSGADFTEVAKNYSEDKISGKKGGDLGWLKEGAVDAAFSEKAFSLEKGAVSEPFETPFGFHIVKLIDGPQVIKKPFDAVKGDIRYQLRNKAKDAELKRLTTEVGIKKYD